MQSTYLIPTENMPALRARVEALNKRAAKIGATSASLTAAFSHTVKQGARLIDYHSVTVEGTAPKIAGWSFVGKINHVDGTVGSVPGMELPARFRGATPLCEHCQTERRRNDTFVLFDGSSHKQVGRSCLADFLGHDNPHDLARVAEFLVSLDDTIREFADENYGGGRGHPVWDLTEFLAVTALVIRKLTWVSRGAALHSSRESTASIVTYYLSGTSQQDRQLRAELGEPTEADKQIAHDAIAWALALPTTGSEYEFNIATIAEAGRVSERTFGLAASMIATYQREEVKRAERAQAEPVPVTDKRIRVEGVVASLKEHDNGYDVRLVMIVLHDAGWKVWGSVPGNLRDLSVGVRVAFMAAVEPSDRDRTFGFFKRPTKAEKVAP